MYMFLWCPVRGSDLIFFVGCDQQVSTLHLSNLPKFDSSRVHICSRQGIARHPLLICRFRVALNLAQAGMATDRRDLIGRASGFGQPSASGFTQTMKRAMRWQFGFIAAVAKPSSEAARCERLGV